MRRLSILLALIGIAVAAGLVVRFDSGAMAAAMLGIGWGGALLLLTLQGGLFCLIGSAWATIQPGIRPRLLIWGRMVRDSATTCLPFSPIGGYALGIRAVALRGPAWTTATAGTVVDVTNEIVAQMLFALLGVSIFAVARPGSTLVVPVGLGTATGLGLLIAALGQRNRIGARIDALATRVLGARAPQAAIVGQEAQGLLADKGRMARAIAIHLCGWILTGAGTWISLRLLGVTRPILPIIALEAVLDAMVAIAFVVPGAIGVQEAGYVGLGGLLGIPPDLALGVSLLRRAREISWGIPILCVWQWQEVRRL